MKKIILLIWLSVLTGGCIYLKNVHQCTDATHQSCDGVCECDGLGCNN